MKNKMRGHYNWTEADKWILANLKLGWKEFQKEFPQFPFTDATFYNRKYKLVKGKKVASQSSRKAYSYRPLYQTLITILKSEMSDEELKGMKRMNDVLEKHAKIKVSIVETIENDIHQIEIRQTQPR